MSNLIVAARVTVFWSKVHKRGPDQCWNWTGYVDKDGYGSFFFEGRMQGAHVLALSFTSGQRRPPGFDTCHSCIDNRLCCNPRHLRFDTRQANVDDMLKAGRHRNGSSKLTPRQVERIRQRLMAGAPNIKLANQYGVSDSTISMIKTGKRHARNHADNCR